MTPKRQKRLVDCGEVPFPLPAKRKPSTETGAAHIICHPELAKDLTAGQPALCHHSPFSKLTAPPDEPSVPITCRLKRTSRSPREILRRLRMTTFGAPFSLLRPICKLVSNGKESPPLSKRLVSGITQSVSCAPSARRCGGKQASPQSCKTLARPQRATASPLRMVSRPFQVGVRRSEAGSPRSPSDTRAWVFSECRYLNSCVRFANDVGNGKSRVPPWEKTASATNTL